MILDLVRGCRAYGGYREEACGAIKGLYYVRAGHNVDARVLPHLVTGGHQIGTAAGRSVVCRDALIELALSSNDLLTAVFGGRPGPRRHPRRRCGSSPWSR